MKIWQWVVIGIVLYSWYIHPNDFTDNIIENVLDGAKQLFEKITGGLNIPSSEGSDKTNYGKPNCLENSDCNTIEECKTDLCICKEGECWK